MLLHLSNDTVKMFRWSHIVPWQLVPGLSILQSKRNLGYPLAARMPLLSWKHPPVLASILRTMNRLGTTVISDGTENTDTHQSESFCANCYCSYDHQQPLGDGQPTLLVPLVPLHPYRTTSL